MKIKSDPKALQKLENYPKETYKKILALRNLIIELAQNQPSIQILEESLKWGELSYTSNKGSTIRIDVKDRHPHLLSIYFTCSTSLVSTFRQVFSDKFNFEKNRAIHLDLYNYQFTPELKQCLIKALTYQEVRNIPLLDF